MSPLGPRPSNRSLARIGATIALPLAVLSCGGGQPAATRTATGTQVAPHRSSARPIAPSSAATAPTTRPAKYRDCGAGITAKKRTTTCPFARNAFYGYWREPRAPVIPVYSTADNGLWEVTCRAGGGQIICTALDGSVVKFSAAAVARYTSTQARAYAARHDLGPTPPPRTKTTIAVPAPTPPSY
jgi:hypothetical protein